METKRLPITYQEHSVDIPYVEIVGAQDGPSAFISGGMHGNEINGIAIVRRFLELLQADGKYPTPPAVLRFSVILPVI